MEVKALDDNVSSSSNVEEKDKNVIEIEDLSNFVFNRVLSRSDETKSIFVEGTFAGKPGPVVLLLQKEPFEVDDVKTLFSVENPKEKVFQNDIYSFFRCLPASICNGIKITSIFPATEKHIQKYSYQPFHVINETPELYKTVTLPYLQSEQFSIDWVFNILEHKSESERIVFEDPDPENGFILLPDLKWDGKTIETLYLLALPVRRGILSLRDLTEKDLPLLNNIYRKGLKAIEEKFQIPASRLRVYFHYQPSFYYLHVHFTTIQSSNPGNSSEKAHLLPTVIDNIKLVPDYYKLATIPFSLKETDMLFAKYEAAGLVKRIEAKEPAPKDFGENSVE